jgi:dihydroorotase
MKILIKEGKIVDPYNEREEISDILIENGRILKIEKEIKLDEQNLKLLDAKGKIVCPGFIDIHTHLREPGYEYKETIATGTKAACRGGFTTIFCMPNTNPVCDNKTVVEFILKKAKEESVISVYPVGAITKNLEGKELSEIGEMKESGIVAISDDGKCVQNSKIMRYAMEYASQFNIPVISHCEDENLSNKGVMNEGYYSTVLGLKGIPSQSESIIVERDIQLSELTGCQLHLTHLSCKKSVELVRIAKRKKLNVTCDVTPHHLLLTEENLINYDTNLKVNPPLRTKQDQITLIEGLKDGTIDCIATDHSPHAIEEKEVEFDYAPFGISSIEIAVSLIVSEFVNKGILTFRELVEKFSVNPAKIFNLNKGKISPGESVDIVIIDPELEWEIDVNKFYSKGKNSPYNKKRLKGKVIAVLKEGKIFQF